MSKHDAGPHDAGPNAETHIGNGKGKPAFLTQTLAEKSAIGTMPLQEAGYQALLLYLRRVRKALAALDYSDDAEAIHDARVAVRELRAIALLLEPSACFNGRWLRQLDKGLGQLAHSLGVVRDTDVFLEHLASFIGTHEGASEGLVWLQHALRRRRQKAAQQVGKALKKAATRRLLRRAQRQLQRLHHVKSDITTSEPAKGKRSDQRYPLLLRHFAGGAIWGRYQEILSYELALPEAGAETLHKLRIACKRLRYSMQIFGQTPPALVEMMATLKAAQDQLGQLHDVYYAEDLTRDLQQASSHGTDHAYQSYRDFLDTLAPEVEQIRASIEPLWQQLTGLPMRQTIAGFIASL
ncbi:MAG: CHAD domain-containing protein [Ktedonobacterales bacterium]